MTKYWDNFLCAVKTALFENNIIRKGDNVLLLDNNTIKTECDMINNYNAILINGKICNFYIIDGVNNIIELSTIIKNLSKKTDCVYPYAIVPPINFDNKTIIIVETVHGTNLSRYNTIDNNKLLDIICDGLHKRLDELSAVKSKRFMHNLQVVDYDFDKIFLRDLIGKLTNPILADCDPMIFDCIFVNCEKILKQYKFSPPTLMQLDFNPFEIVYNEKTRQVMFTNINTFAFTDYDYGWAKLILSQFDNHNEFYCNLIAELSKRYITIEEAVKIPKYKVYLYYFTLCKLIESKEKNLVFSNKMKRLYTKLTKNLSQDIKNDN